MHPRLPLGCLSREPVRISIAREQQRLVDEHRAVPHRRCAAQLGQSHARDHRLDKEEQEAAGENGEDEQAPPAQYAAACCIAHPFARFLTHMSRPMR